MSMLADRKRKPMWILKPRGKRELDPNNAGKKMLEKMGWSDGKGLGVNEHGMTEHITQTYKCDVKGIGYKDNGEQWTQHEDNFSSLLAALGGGEAAPSKPMKSLEEKSQKSRVRVHYGKFTRGKDLSRYSDKDLANVFGKKTLVRQAVPIAPVDEDATVSTFGVDTIQRGSMVDYFKKKLNGNTYSLATSNNLEIGSNGVLKTIDPCDDYNDDEDRPKRGGFGFNAEPKRSEEDVVVEDKSDRGNLVDYFKRKLMGSFVKDDSQSGPIKKIKRKRSSDGDDEATDPKQTKTVVDFGTVNPAFDPNGRRPFVQVKHVLTTIAEEEDVEDVDVAVAPAATERKIKKAKRSKPHVAVVEEEDGGFSNPNVDVEESVDEERKANGDLYEVKRKKKKNKAEDKCNGYSNPAVDLDVVSREDDVQVYEVKRKKKNNKAEDKCNGYCNPAVDLDVVSREDDVQMYEVKRKKKDKKKSKTTVENGVDNPAMNLSFRSDDSDNNNSATEASKKKRTKTVRQQPEDGLDNPALNVSNGEAATVRSSAEEVSPVKKHKSNKSKRTGLDNAALNVSAEDEAELKPIPDSDEARRKELFEINDRIIESNDGAENAAEGVAHLSDAFDLVQSILENDMNERKYRRAAAANDHPDFRVEPPDDENSSLGVVLKYREDKKLKASWYGSRNCTTPAKKSYTHLISHDIVVGFTGTNFHTIEGYSEANGTL